MLATEKPYFRILPPAVLKRGAAAPEAAARFIARLGVNPNALTILGLAAGAGAGVFFALGLPVPALAAGALCGFLDILDGRVAALSGRRSAFGAILDSAADRYTEFFALAGVAWYFHPRWPAALAAAAFLGGTMVSYTRACAERLGYRCRLGLMQRAERLAVLGAAAAAGALFRVYDQALIAALGLIAVFGNVTAWQRIWSVRRRERRGAELEGDAQ